MSGKMKKSSKKESFKTFLGSKKEGQGFADKRKRKTAYEYLKLLKKEKRQGEVQGKEVPKHKPIEFLRSQNRSPVKGKKNHAFSAAQKIAKKKQEASQKSRQEAEKIKQERRSALTAYKDRKRNQHLKLCKRTSKGQPVMKYQMEVLLDKIKKQKGQKD